MNIVIGGAGHVGYHAAEVLVAAGHRVTVVDSDANALRAIQDSLDAATLQGSCSEPRVLLNAGADKADLVVAATNHDEVNLLAVEQFVPTFGRPHLYRAAAADPKRRQPAHPGRALFGADLDVDTLRSKLHRGGRIRATKLTEKFGAGDYRDRYGDRAHPLFVVSADEKLQIVTAGGEPTLKAGQTVLALIEEDDRARGPADPQAEPI